jgi:hypothetical protein
MKAKLTLSVEPEIIRKARRLSSKQKKSVSLLFEEFIDQQDRMKHPANDSVVDRLIGILHDTGKDYDEMKKEYRENKLRKNHG